MTPRDRERRRETEKERVFVSIPTKKTSNSILSKKAVIERERGFSVSCKFCRGKCPESTRRDHAHHLPTPRPRRTFAFALVRDASTNIRVLLEARAASKNARINFSLQVFRPSLLKSLSPFGGTHTFMTRKNPRTSGLPRARTSSPFLARENRRRRN